MIPASETRIPLPANAVLNRVPVGIAVFGPDLRLRRCNPAWAAAVERFSGLPAASVAPGLGFFELAPGTEPELAPLLGRVLAGEEVRVDGLRLERAGTVSWWDIALTPLAGEGGPVGLVNVVTEATEREQAVEALRQSEERFRALVQNATDMVTILDPDGTRRYASPATERLLGYAPAEIVGGSVYPLIHPEDVATVRANLAATAAAPGVGPAFRFRVRRADGAWRWFEAVGSNRLADPAVGGLVFNARDVTEGVEAFRLLEERVAERTRELRTLLDISHDVAATLELRPLLAVVLDRLKEVVDYAGAAVFALGDGDGLDLLQYRGPIPPEGLAWRWDLASAAHVAEVVRTGRPVIVADVGADDPLAAAFRAKAGDVMGEVRADQGSWMGVPLSLGERVTGVLSVESEAVGFYTPRHAELALAVAEQAAVAIENARLYGEARKTAAFEERQRLARELHDSVAQALYGIGLGARSARAHLERDPAGVVEPLEYVCALADGALAEMRALIFELRPESLATEGLVAALGRRVAVLRSRHALEVEEHLGPEPEVGLATKEALYRIALEATHNTVKHARAGRVRLALTAAPDTITLEVADDGVGFDPGAAYPGHLGLRSMRERADRLGGRLDLVSSPGRGTRVRAVAPR